MVLYLVDRQLLGLQMRSYLYHGMPSDLGVIQVCFVLKFSADDLHSESLADKH